MPNIVLYVVYRLIFDSTINKCYNHLHFWDEKAEGKITISVFYTEYNGEATFQT